MKEFKIVSVNLSATKGIPKTPVSSVRLVEGFGMESDVHGGPWHRQVSLLGREDIDAMIAKGASVDNGVFAENITTMGVDLAALPVGTRLEIGDARLEVTQIGKECHSHCAIHEAVGDCVMPRRGVFARVLKGGLISNESIGRYDF